VRPAQGLAVEGDVPPADRAQLLQIRLQAGGEVDWIKQPEDAAEGVVRGRAAFEREKLPQHVFFGVGKIGHVHAAFGSAQAGAKGNDQDV
jgi:hypothetical protein